MENIKSSKKKLVVFFFFFHKKVSIIYIYIYSKLMALGDLQTFSYIIKCVLLVKRQRKVPFIKGKFFLRNL